MPLFICHLKKMKSQPVLFSILLIIQIWTRSVTSSFKDWDPFKSGVIYRSPLRFLSRKVSPETRADNSESTNGSTSYDDVVQTNTEVPTTQTVLPQSLGWESNLVSIPPEMRHLCYPNSTNFVSVATQFNSGSYCVFMETIYTCIDKPYRSNHYPIVSFIKQYDPRYVNVKINSALRLRTETHFFSYYLVTSFIEQERIRAIPKTLHFEAIKNIIPTSSFAFEDPDHQNRWILVVDNATEPVEGTINYYRHFIEEGDKMIGVIPQKEEIDAALVYLRRKNYVEGYSIVGQLFYKFMFSTKGEYSEKNEFLRMLWGHNQEFIGCPKPVCLAPVVDTIFRLKDNRTYVFIGKYYWNMAYGLSIEKAVFIDAISSESSDTRFPYLGADIDATFYDPRPLNDTIYFLKGGYIYSYTKTDEWLLERMIYGNHIEEVMKGIPRDINAAFYYRPNSTVYFFREYHYWAYDLDNKRVLSGFPRLVTDFENMPHNIDAIYSDNFGKYYVFYGTFFATFTEEEFRIGMKLEFKLSNVDFFGCDPSLYGNYIEYKKKMETEFGPLSAKQVLELTDNEGFHLDNDNIEEKGMERTKEDEKVGESFLTTFAKLIVYGPFLYDLSIEQKPQKEKITYYTTYIET